MVAATKETHSVLSIIAIVVCFFLSISWPLSEVYSLLQMARSKDDAHHETPESVDTKMGVFLSVNFAIKKWAVYLMLQIISLQWRG